MFGMSALLSRVHIPRSQKGATKKLTDGNIASIRNEKSSVAKSLRLVHKSWDMIRRPFHRKGHVTGPTVNSNIDPVQQATLRSISPVPGFKQTVGGVQGSLSIAAIAQQKKYVSTNQHNTSPHLDPEQIGDSARQVTSRGPSIEFIGTTAMKRISTHSRDGSRVSTKRIKKGEHDPRDLEVSAELVQAENRERRLQNELDELKVELKMHENTAKNAKAKAAQYMQQWEILQQEVQNNWMVQAKELAKGKQAAEQQEQAYREAIAGFDAKMKYVQKENLQLTSALRVNEEILAEYRNDIARLSNERPDSTRDDHYYEKSFSKLFRSIENWVLQYYLTVNPKLEDLTNLHPLIQKFLTTIVADGQTGLAVLQSEPLYTIQAYIASQIAFHVLKPVLLGLVEDSYEKLYNIIAPCAGAEQLTKWRISTISIISRTEEYSKAVSTKVEEVANNLVASLATLLPESPQYKPGPRTKRLKAIVEQATKLALEVQQEPSTISYSNFEPATTCDASYMADAKGLTNEAELQDMGTFVRLTVYPAVVRKPYNEEERVVLVKAKILAAHAGPGGQ